jgi:hypothetical protein
VIIAGSCGRARRQGVPAAPSAAGGGLADYAPAKVAEITGVAAKRVERLARELAERAPAVAVIGSAPLARGLFHALAVNALNELLGGPARRPVLYARRAALSRGPPSWPPRCNREGPPARRRTRSSARRRHKVRDAIDKVHVHRQLRQLRRRHQRARGSDSARPLVPRVGSTARRNRSIEAVTTVAEPVMKPLYQQTRATAMS